MKPRNEIYRSGLIPYYIDSNDEIQMLFMRPSNVKYGGNCFQISKGKLDDEDEGCSRTAAVREAVEELGLRESNIDGEVIFVSEPFPRMSVYICKVKNQEDFDPFDGETLATKWMTVREFISHGRELHVPVVQSAHNLICIHEGRPELICYSAN